MRQNELRERLKVKQELRQHYIDRTKELDAEIASIVQKLAGTYDEPEQCISCGS